MSITGDICRSPAERHSKPDLKYYDLNRIQNSIRGQVSACINAVNESAYAINNANKRSVTLPDYLGKPHAVHEANARSFNILHGIAGSCNFLQDLQKLSANLAVRPRAFGSLF